MGRDKMCEKRVESGSSLPSCEWDGLGGEDGDGRVVLVFKGVDISRTNSDEFQGGSNPATFCSPFNSVLVLHCTLH